MTQDLSPTISAEAILRSPEQRSRVVETESTTVLTTPEAAVPEVMTTVSRQFEAMGFTVLAVDNTLTIQGAAALFEAFFQVRLQLIPDDLTGIVYVHHTGDVVVPPALQSRIETIIFPEPPEY